LSAKRYGDEDIEGREVIEKWKNGGTEVKRIGEGFD
jgi:hypothetical protein